MLWHLEWGSQGQQHAAGHIINYLNLTGGCGRGKRGGILNKKITNYYYTATKLIVYQLLLQKHSSYCML